MNAWWQMTRQSYQRAILYAKSYSRSHDAVIRAYDAAGNVIETHEHAGDFKSGDRSHYSTRKPLSSLTAPKRLQRRDLRGRPPPKIFSARGAATRPIFSRRWQWSVRPQLSKSSPQNADGIDAGSAVGGKETGD